MSRHSGNVFTWTSRRFKEHYLGHQKKHRQEMNTNLQQLSSGLMQVTVQLAAHSFLQSPPLVSAPEKIICDPAPCQGFDPSPWSNPCPPFSMVNFFASKGVVSDQKCIAGRIGLLTEAVEWATVIWESGSELIASYERFLMLFKHVFDHASKGKEVVECLMSCQQGQCRVVEYALEFHTVAAESG